MAAAFAREDALVLFASMLCAVRNGEAYFEERLVGDAACATMGHDLRRSSPFTRFFVPIICLFVVIHCS